MAQVAREYEAYRFDGLNFPITEDGPFRYDYEWLAQDGRPEDSKSDADRVFGQAFGRSPASATLMPSWLRADRAPSPA